ncbi:hypothetical protein H5410_010803 [Solanum commersonii]|uniref:Protein RETICULATA-RELATED 1, chloroplastic n=1 Tax=Solanum commersonii TaxID=4109 RepID=A0A9J6AMH5_SOLCO|nr:hypothetical protein H5410_010803 [Solanum commersonii]
MSLPVFQTAQIKPINTQIIPYSKPLFPPLLCRPIRAFKVCKIKATASPAVDGDPVSGLERCFQGSPALDHPASSSSSTVMFAPVMKGGKYGALGSVTLEKGKLDMSSKQLTSSTPEARHLSFSLFLEQEEVNTSSSKFAYNFATSQLSTGGGGGNMGKNLNHGGGDGGDDDGDDDDYFDDFDDGDEGDEGGLFRRRMLLQELFDRKFVDAVLNEWQKTMLDLPPGLRQAYEMGLVSSAQLVNFLAYNARPTVARFISRLLPQGLSRAFNGRENILDKNLSAGYTVCSGMSEISFAEQSSYSSLLQIIIVLASQTCLSTHLPRLVQDHESFGFDLLLEGAAVLLYPSKTLRELTAPIFHEDQITPAEHIRYKTLQDEHCSGYISPKVESFVNHGAEDCRSSFFEQAASGSGTYNWLLCVVGGQKSIKQEWDLALLNVLTATACNAAVFWTLAPCQSYGNTFRYDLQNTLQKLPNNIFEKSYPLREFDLQKRIHSFFYKAAELCMIGLSAGAVQGALSNLLASKKEGRLSVSIPSVSSNALGYGAFLGVYANLRYQLLNGFDRAVFNYFDVIGVALVFSTAMRALNVQVGETSRLAWLGVEVDPLAHSDDVLKAYSRPTEGGVEQSSSKWFISKNSIVSGLGLLGIKQGQSGSTTEGETSAPKARRKRIVRKKVAS